MKFVVQMKDPDTLDDSIAAAVARSFDDLDLKDEDERDAIEGARREKIKKVCARWFKWGEYLAVEIDIEAGTCTVLDAK